MRENNSVNASMKYGVVLACAFVLAGFVSFPVFQAEAFSLVSPVFAEDEDEEDEEEYEDDEDDRNSSTASSSGKSTTTRYEKVIQNVTEYRTVTKTISVTPDEYMKDSDGDALVDAIDPNPNTKQQEFFTDTDDDGIPNAFDKYHDSDDFTYFDGIEKDDNGNGIFDSYED